MQGTKLLFCALWKTTAKTVHYNNTTTKTKQTPKNVSSHVRKKTTTTKHSNTYRKEHSKDNNRASAIETKRQQLRIL